MLNKIKNKLLIIAILLTTIFTSVVSILGNTQNVSASSVTGTTQTTIKISEIYREDNLLHFVLDKEMPVNQITYEYTHMVNGKLESDLININPKKEDSKSYYIELPTDAIGIKIWKIRYQESKDYYKNKYTTGNNQVGNIDSTRKKNYITVTADKLVAYEYNSKEMIKLPWYLWSNVGIGVVLGDYLFRAEKSASYTWYFSVDREIDEIVDVDLEYATFEYTEAMWGLLESKHDYHTHQKTIEAKTDVFDYEKYVNASKELCKGLSEAICNNRLKETGEEYFHRNAIGASTIEGYDWYVQVTLDDLLKGNNVLWGAYENTEYLQEVALLRISYYFNGEYFDVNVLDEDTGELTIIPDKSPIEKVTDFLVKVFDWISNAFNKVKSFFSSHSWIFWIIIALIVISILSIFFEPIKKILIIITFPISIPISLAKKKHAIKKEEEQKRKEKEENREFIKQMIQDIAVANAAVQNQNQNQSKQDVKKEKKENEKTLKNKYYKKKGNTGKW